MKRGLVVLLILCWFGRGTPTAQAQDFKDCQSLFTKCLQLFNQAVEENDPKILQSAEYRRELLDLQRAYRDYHKTYYNPADSVQKYSNEAVLNALSGNYSKALRVLTSLDSLDQLTSYQIGLLHLLSRDYPAARASFTNSTASKFSVLNTLVTFGREGSVSDGLLYAQGTPHRSQGGKWNYNVGLLFKQNHQYPESVGEVTSAIRQKDEMAYRLLRGDVLMKLKKSKSAVSDFEKVAKRNHKAQIRYANALVDLKRYPEAQASFEEYLESDDKKFRMDAFLGLGHTFYALGQFENAQKYYRLAAAIMKNSQVALCGQANVLVSRRLYAAAKGMYDRILDADSTYVSAYLGRGVTHYGLKEYQKALDDFERAKTLFNPEDRSLADIFVSRGFAKYYTKKSGAALSDFETAVRLDPNRYEALAGISGILVDQKSFSLAGQYLSRALTHEKTYDKMWSNYGNLLLHFDMFKKGYEVFRKAIALNPQNLKAQNGWGVVLLENDQLNQSRALFDSLVEANPTVPFLLNNRGIVNAYQGNRSEQKKLVGEADEQYQLAFNDFKKAMEVAPGRKFYNVNQGNVFRYWQKYDEAKLSYQTYQDKSALNNTAVLHAGLENYKDAKYYLGVAIQIDSSNRVFQFNMNLLLKGTQKKFASSLAAATASNDTEGGFSDIGIKYSRDGFVTIYLYDYEYDTLYFPGRHYLPLPVAEYDEEYFIPEYDFKLIPYTEKKLPKDKNKKGSYKSQKVALKKRGRRSGTQCPIF